MRPFLLLCVLSVALGIGSNARADSFEQFTVSGNFFFGTPGCTTTSGCPLTGGFVIDETTGQVTSVNIQDGSIDVTTLNGAEFLSGSTMPVPFTNVGGLIVFATTPDVYDLFATNDLACSLQFAPFSCDEMDLSLFASGPAVSLTSYAGGLICGDFDPFCPGPSTLEFPGNPGVDTNSLRFDGLVTDDGPVMTTPEPSSVFLLLLGIGFVVLMRNRWSGENTSTGRVA